ncbi:hypothetical protein AALP_AA6G160100 [Arabis alpina]|uniref:Knl1 C-terminal RWD domain-containing protein n=1 Tax=Arabis alpina TaxID=50452 RepID=A0A087GPJ4_ARAAL|nr:hypothetical protein AALP_AA6G160100 [Arabis alpina]
MASEDPMNNSGGTEEETIAQRRKRLRRVSFADREITSIHIFKRDEDYETPPNSEPQNADTSESENKVARFFGELANSEQDTEGDGDGEDDAVVEKLFLRPKGSPSSGGSTIGSATRTDDEDNFFGPVSSHFINPGRLSDATISEEHHDITMDSTAFSMHYRSLAMSEAGEVQTPMSTHLPVEDKTPTHTASAMEFTNPKKRFPKSPLPVDKASGGKDSNDMSIVGENSRKYDYGHISPALEALLAAESNELPPASSVTPVHDFSLSPPNGCIPRGQSYKDPHGVDSSAASQMLSPYGSGCHPQIVLQESGSQRYTKETPLPSSITRRQSASLVGILPQFLSCVTPSPKQGGSFMSRETLALVESLSTIQKSKSRLGLIPSSPGSALFQRIEKSKLQLSERRSMTTPSTIGREDIVVRREKHADIPFTNFEDLLSEHDNRTPVSEKKGIPDQHSSGALSPAVDSSDVFAGISSEENTNSEIEGSLLEQKERNQTATTPDKFVSSLANSSNATMSALKNFVTLHDKEQHSKDIGKSETQDGNITKDCASNYSMITLSDKVDSLLAESGELLSKTGFFNGSAQQKEKDSVLKKNQNTSNNSAAAHCETEVVSTEDFPAVVTEDLPGTSGSSSMDRSENEASKSKGPSRLKRKTEGVDRGARSCSPKVRKKTQYLSNPVMDHPDGNYDANDRRVVREQVINWVEIPGKVSVEINQMLAPLADKLNSRLICKLEDILTHLKKVHLCEMLCLQIQSQKVCDDLSGLKTKRRAESRSSLCKLAYGKAKLELLHLKQEIMMKKFQAVSTAVQTSEILRLNCAKLLRQHGFHSTGLLNREETHEVTPSKRAEITQEIKVLDSKVKTLIKCVPTCNKITATGELAYADTIKIAEDNLKGKMSCRFICQDILGWKVDSLGENCQSIVLNYSGLINQRPTLKLGPVSCILISNSLSDTFVKHFPDMNVSIAFNSLFNAEYSHKYVGSNTLLEITQKTSLVLQNLLDVAEELQLARMEIPNLVQGTFDSPSAEQLHLQISFINCTNLRKVIMVFDVACLTHGKYPGDIIPHELAEVSGTKKDDGVVSEQVMNEIQSAMDNVGVGYPRILRLCRCISKSLQSQSRR